MMITYRDAIGVISVQVNDDTISFLDGFVYFDDEKVPVENVVSITYDRITRERYYIAE